MPGFLRSFLLMITFLTRIPFPITFEFNNEDFIKGFKYFPLIGSIIGGLICLPLFGQDYMPESITAFLIIIVYLFVVGGLHIDGVSDVFDGIFSARKRERMLVIMEDSRIGAFGAIGLILYFLGIFIGLKELIIITGTTQSFIKLPIVFAGVIMMPIVGRTMALVVAGISRYAKEGGMGKSLIDENTPLISFVLIVLLSGLGIMIDLKFLIAVFITTVIDFMITKTMHRVLNGVTGDVIGMVVEVSQVVFLLSLVILYY